MRTALALVAFLALGAAAPAQTHVFNLLQSSSNFTWSGTSTLGPIVGNPSNAFQLAGTVNIDLVLQAGAQPVASGAFTGGAAATVPDLHGRIPNPIPLLPPLATIDVLGLVVTPTSPSFPVALDGSFTATVTLTAVAGTMVVTPLGQAATSTPLAGSTSTPSAATGSLLTNSAAIRLNMPVNSTFPFSDPTSGASGTITVVGTLVADHVRVQGFCAGDGTGTACPCGNSAPAGSGRGCLNSTGIGALLAGSGAAVVSADTFVLAASGMPATTTALFFQGDAQAAAGAGTVFGDGKRCVATSIVRLGTKATSAGAASFPGAGDPAVSVRGGVPAAGAIRHYQVWYRNAAVYCTADGFNLSNGVRVTWLP
jgi:hypothetical protein